MGNSVILNKSFSLQLFNAVDDVPIKHWNSLLNDSTVFLDVKYLKAIELAFTKNQRVVYCILFKGDLPAASLYFQAIDLESIKIGSVIHAEPYGKFLKLVSDKITNSLIKKTKDKTKWMLVNGNMNASGMYGICCAAVHKAALSKLFPEIISNVSKLLSKTGDISVCIVKDFEFEDDYLQQVLKNERFIRFVMDPVMVFHVDKKWKSFEDYLQSLSSKYRLRAVNVMEKLDDLELRELNCEAIKRISGKLNKLYQDVIGKSPVRIVHPDINYIYHLKEQLGEKFTVKCWFLKNEPVAFYTTFNSKQETDAHHIGIDYHLNKQYSLYQSILYNLVADTIKNGSGRLNYGRTALEMKSSVGAVPENFSAYIKLGNRVLNHLIKPFLPSNPPDNWVQRDPYRKY